MKALTTIASGLLALAFGGTAFAVDPVVIYIAGSNGDRVVSNTAIPKLLGGTPVFAGTNATPSKANFGIWKGGTFNGVPVTIKVAYIGATGGIAAVAGSLTVKFLPDSATGGNNLDPTVGDNPNDPQVPTFTLSTNFQSTSPYSGEYLGHTYVDPLVDKKIAVIGLKWLASKNYPGDNFTTQLAQLLFTTGELPLSLFTGDVNDLHKSVFATGRNQDAGQRYVALLESGLGVNTLVKHYKPSISGAAAGVGGYVVGGTVVSQAIWPDEPYSNGTSGELGNGGASTGANLAPYLTAVLSPAAYQVNDSNVTAGYYISYLTTGDADTIAIPNGAVELKWNGVPFSVANVQQGKYTFWTYEHIMYLPTLTGTGKDFADQLAEQIKTVDANVAGIFLDSNLKVSRIGDGTLVAPEDSL